MPATFDRSSMSMVLTSAYTARFAGMCEARLPGLTPFIVRHIPDADTRGAGWLQVAGGGLWRVDNLLDGQQPSVRPVLVRTSEAAAVQAPRFRFTYPPIWVGRPAKPSAAGSKARRDV